MDPEQTFLRVHERLSRMLSQLLTPPIRKAMEYINLALALSLFALLVVMHINFVQQPGCSSELSRTEIAGAQLVQIKITGSGLWSQNAVYQNVMDTQEGILFENLEISGGNAGGFTFSAAKFWSSWTYSGSRKKLSLKPWKNGKDVNAPQVDHAADSSEFKTISDEAEFETDAEVGDVRFPSSARESVKATIIHAFSKWHMYLSYFWRHVNQFAESACQLWDVGGWDLLADAPKVFQMLHLEQAKLFVARWLKKRSKALEPTYLYTTEKGYFFLPEGARARHNICTVNISISAQHPCFGNRWQQLLINSFVGYDTILMNSLLSFPGPGHLCISRTKDFYDLSYGLQPLDGPAKFGDYFVTKCSVLIMSLFVFFTTTMSVSFTLRETQSRMLKFTVQLQHHARHRLPTFQLILLHVVESLVFVPIMIGILFFLFEFYHDQVLAFLVLILVWVCELFTMISVRTSISMQFFPRFFLLYFLVFHIYFFSYPYGFSYLAFSTTAAFMQHLIIFFWNHYEVPALDRLMRQRSQLQLPTGVQITSSTIVTSTLHIARLNDPIPRKLQKSLDFNHQWRDQIQQVPLFGSLDQTHDKQTLLLALVCSILSVPCCFLF
uniref:Membralin n=1 Tax=Anthurium amnicola TaxID=1678845 RepID=A0A1D1XLX2_9ARAE